MHNHLTNEAYEPLRQADIEHLTQKTLFLLATAAKMTVINAIDFLVHNLT